MLWEELYQKFIDRGMTKDQAIDGCSILSRYSLDVDDCVIDFVIDCVIKRIILNSDYDNTEEENIL